MSNNSISIITTSFNCAGYIETTIKSVINQDVKAQYIIMDAASTDNTMDIVNRYKDSIDVISSEPDDGMYHGIQKGAQHVTGDIMAWINADDAYLPWAFSIVKDIFDKHPDIDWIIGQPSYMNEKGQCTKVSSNAGTAYPQKYIQNGWFQPQFAGYLQQESMFWRKSLWDKVDGLNLDIKLAADFELWTKFAQHADLYSVSVPLSSFRLRPGEQQSSVSGDKYSEEVAHVCQGLIKPNSLWRFMSNHGEVLRVLSRMLIWKKAKYLKYSAVDKGWVIKEKYRPLSRYSITEVLSEL